MPIIIACWAMKVGEAVVKTRVSQNSGKREHRDFRHSISVSVQIVYTSGHISNPYKWLGEKMSEGLG